MKSEYFVVGDVHGKIDLLKSLLTNWNQENQQLIFLGDIIDRGEDSKSCLFLVKELVEEKKAICLTGNHERMFLAWLDDPQINYEHYRRNGGDSTINSLLGRNLDAKVDGMIDAHRILKAQKSVVDFLKTCPYYFEDDSYIFVHAGIDFSQEDWRQTSQHDFVWLRTPFHDGRNTTGKMIVFGHTPVYKLYQTSLRLSQIWMSDDGKIGIDGGAVYGGVLHGVVFDATGLVCDYTVGCVERPTNFSDSTIN